MNSMTIDPEWTGDGLHIGIVRARFNEEIGALALDATLAELTACGVEPNHVLVMSVPGALELGTALQKLANINAFDALIALGAVIRGETYHFELVSNESAAAISRVAHESGIPVLNGVLTTDTEEQARARAAEKGRDCARGAVEMANLLEKLQILEDTLDEYGGMDDDELDAETQTLEDELHDGSANDRRH